MQTIRSSKFLTVIAFAVLFYSPAFADFDLNDFNKCYTRVYSSKHLRKQPKQNVVKLAMKIDAKNDAVTLSGTNRDGQFGHLLFVCDEGFDVRQNLPICGTFERDSQLTIEKRSGGGIAIITLNVYLSDIGEDINDVDDKKGHHVFYLEEGGFAPHLAAGPLFRYKLDLAPPNACPIIE